MKISTLQKGLVGHWAMNGNAKDGTPYGNNGTVTGATLTTDMYGVANRAYSFDGSLQYITINPADKTILQPNQLTISGWVNTAYNNSTGIVFMHGEPVNIATSGYVLYQNRFYIITPSGSRSTSTYTHTKIGWIHVVGTYDGAILRLYADGVLVRETGSTSENIIYNVGRGIDTFRIGAYSYITTSLPGNYSDIRLYNRALSGVEVSKLYNSYRPALQLNTLGKGLVGHWAMNGNAKDGTPYANNGAVTGATLTTDRYGVANRAYSFDGVDDLINLGQPTVLDIGTSDFSLHCVVKTSDVLYRQPIYGKRNTSNGHSLLFRFGNYSRIQFGYGIGGNSGNWETSNPLSTNTWYVITVIGKRGEPVKFYRDGVLQEYTDNSGNLDASHNLTVNVPLYLGYYNNPTFAWGKHTIQEFRQYNRALSEQEVLQLYNSYRPALQLNTLGKGLVGHWAMNGNAKDGTPNGNNGTVTGATLTTDMYGVANRAYSFDGTDDFITLSTIPDTTSWSVGVWFKNSGSSVARGIIEWSTASSKRKGFSLVNGYPIIMYGDNKYKLGNSRVNTGNWLYGVVTYDGTTPRIYINSVFYATGSEISGSVPENPNTAFIGRLTIGSPFYSMLGSITDVRIYNRALTQAEITQLYNSYN